MASMNTAAFEVGGKWNMEWCRLCGKWSDDSHKATRRHKEYYRDWCKNMMTWKPSDYRHIPDVHSEDDEQEQEQEPEPGCGAVSSVPGLEDDVRELRRQLFEQQGRIRDLEQRDATQDRELVQLKDAVRRIADDSKRRRLG